MSDTYIEYSVIMGETFSAMACISSLVSASIRLKNMEATFSSVSPLCSIASMVFANVGSSGLATMASISALASFMACSKAGR